MIGIKNLIRHLKILLYISFSWRFFLSWRLYKKNRKKKYKTRNKKNKKKFFFNFLYLFLFFLFPSICNDPKDRNKRRKGNDLLLRWILETRLFITKCKSSLLVRVDLQKSTSKSDTYLHVVCYNPSVLRANEVATQELSEPRHMTPWPRRAAEAVGVCSVIETKQTISPAKFWKRNRGEKGAWPHWRIQLHLTATWVSCEIPEKLLPRATLICRLELPASSWTNGRVIFSERIKRN